VSHMIIIYLCKYNNLQLFISSIDQCELPKKCVGIISYHDGNVFRNFIALSGSYAKIIMFLLSAYWPIVPPLLVCFKLTNMAWQC
jgi:hypothetical protein